MSSSHASYEVIPKRETQPSAPSPQRAISQLSIISVEGLRSESPSLQQTQSRLRTLSAPGTPRTKTAPDVGATGTRTEVLGQPVLPSQFSASLMRHEAQDSGESSSRHSVSPRPSFKGKERASETVEVDELSVAGVIIHDPDDISEGLRNIVRRTTDGVAVSNSDAAVLAEDIPISLPHRTYLPRRYYVLTHAGKPVFRSHDDTSEETITNLMGIAQALISIFAEEDDRPRSIIHGHHRISFVLKPPLYLFCVSDWGEAEYVLRQHLEYLHLQIISIVTSSQLSRVFQRRSNFDLSRLLEGTESFLHNLTRRFQDDIPISMSALQPLRMAPALRDTAAAALMPPTRFQDLLYVLLLGGGLIVSLLRPRKHAIHPSDLHLLLNILESSATLRSGETWLPVCLPKFNPAGFVHAYISYELDDIALVFVSADREAFEDLRKWKGIVLERLAKDNTLAKIQQAIPHHPFRKSELGCQGLYHFIYKSRSYIQTTSPAWEPPYQDEAQRIRLMLLYQRLQEIVHARAGQANPMKLAYLKTDHEACLAWITYPFELYIAVSPQMSKSAVIAVANQVARWITAEEGKIFLKDAPVF